MTVRLPRRLRRRAGAVAVAGLMSTTAMLFGASAGAATPTATTEPTSTPTAQATTTQATTASATRVRCTIDLSTRPVKVASGERVQLALNLAGIWIDVGEPQQVGDRPGERTLSAVVTGVLGLVGQLCSAVVEVEAAVSEIVPLPEASVPDVPLPRQQVDVPLPGAEVSVGTAQDAAPSQPEPSMPVPGEQEPGERVGGGDQGRGVDWRHGNARGPLYDFTALPYRTGYRFGDQAGPAFRYGQRVPGYSPRFGILESGGDDVANTGTVRALPVSDGARVAFPVLVAVLLLSVVTGALVRTWVLRP